MLARFPDQNGWERNDILSLRVGRQLGDTSSTLLICGRNRGTVLDMGDVAISLVVRHG
jgi:hypothetical protein